MVPDVQPTRADRRRRTRPANRATRGPPSANKTGFAKIIRLSDTIVKCMFHASKCALAGACKNSNIPSN